MSRARTLAAGVVLAATACACQWILGIGDDSFSYAAPDAAPDADTASGPDLCMHATPPPRPTAEGQDIGLVLFAMKKLDISGTRDGGARVGYDLDGVCSCDPADHSAKEGGIACTPPPDAASVCDDGGGGIDNAVADLYASNSFFGLQSFTDTFNSQLRCGRQTLIVFLTGYNGKADDKSVGVALVPSLGIRELHGTVDAAGESTCDEVVDGSPQTFRPHGDVTDLWSMVEGSISSATGRPPPEAFLEGWVTNGRLVVDGRSGAKALPFVVGGARFDLRTPVLTADIIAVDAGAPSPPSFALANGVIAGRVATSDFLHFLATAPIRLPDDTLASLCDPDAGLAALYNTVKGVICSGADLRSAPSEDFSSAPCDAISLALQFEAAPATTGDRPVPPLEPGCDGGFVDSCD
jgi:hypothetical protein